MVVIIIVLVILGFTCTFEIIFHRIVWQDPLFTTINWSKNDMINFWITNVYPSHMVFVCGLEAFLNIYFRLNRKFLYQSKQIRSNWRKLIQKKDFYFFILNALI
jgi:hypothetical protein